MPEHTDKLFDFADLSKYSFKQRLMIRFADVAFYVFIYALGSLSKFEIYGREHFEEIVEAHRIPIYTFWHDRIFLSAYFFQHRDIVVMASQSFDGEYIARFVQRFGYGVIRGSSSRRGGRALIEMGEAIEAGHGAAFTLDGPRGPRYKVKKGPVILAKMSGNPILPFVIQPRRFWTVNSWDRLQIPKPFSKVAVIAATPIYVASDADDDEIEKKLAELQASLDELVEKGEEWANAGT